MATMTTTTTTTTTSSPATSMLASQRVLLEAFPNPPCHIPNPPPSGPPSLPLPPVPGPSRVSVDEQLLFLSSITTSRRSSRYSLRESIIGNPTPSPTSPSFLIRHESRMDASWRRSKHHHNESISSIDVRAILAVDVEDLPTSPSQKFASPTSSESPLSPFPPTPSSVKFSPPETQIKGLATDVAPSSAVKILRLERRAERTKSAGLKNDLTIRSRSGAAVGITTRFSEPTELPYVSSPDPNLSPSITTSILPAIDHGKNSIQLGALPVSVAVDMSTIRSPTKSSFSSISQSANPSSQSRVPSPDIHTILNSTPRPAIRKSASHSRLGAYRGIIRKTISGGPTSDSKRRASEGVMRSVPSWHSHYSSGIQKNGTLSRPEGEVDTGSDGELGTKKAEDGDESDSSLDLHTPLPHLMVRDGLLSPNSRLLPTPTRRRDGRSDSVMTAGTSFTKSGIMKDERDTPMRRVRHRDNRLLKGGIGLTTGLGWSDSEDEDAPSPLTRRLSTLNLSRQPSSSSVRSSTSHRHPLSRSYSSGALLESEYGPLEEVDEEPILSPPARPRIPSTSRLLSRSTLPPTSWSTKTTSTPAGARTSTSSVGSTFSVDTALSEGSALRGLHSKLTRPRDELRDSSASYDAYDQLSLVRKNPQATNANTTNDRLSSSTASTLSTTGAIPSTPRDRDPYDPALSSPGAFGISVIPKPYSFNMEKSLPPIPKGGLKNRPSNSRLQDLSNSYSFPRVRTVSNNSSIPSSPTTVSPVRPLQLPRQASRIGKIGGLGDRAAVPVPRVLSSSTSQSSLRSPITRSPPTDGMVRLRPRTGTGMIYRTSSGSQMRPPMTLSSSTSILQRTKGDSLLGRTNVSRIPPV